MVFYLDETQVKVNRALRVARTDDICRDTSTCYGRLDRFDTGSPARNEIQVRFFRYRRGGIDRWSDCYLRNGTGLGGGRNFYRIIHDHPAIDQQSIAFTD